MSQEDPVVIVGAARTAMGGFQGDLKAKQAPELGAVAIRAALERARVGAEDVDEVLMGCVLPAGLGQAPARQASLGAGLPEAVGCTTVNKVCGSGMKAAMLGHDLIVAGSAAIVVAGGMESMSNAPYLLDRARAGYRLGHGRVLDHMFLDGLEDAYDRGRLMGTFAEDTAQAYQFTREAQDAYAVESLRRAKRAGEDGSFAVEIVPVSVNDRGGESLVDKDEQPRKADPAKIPTLKPAFRPDGTVTAANSSSISDGAAALILMRRSEADRRGLAPLAGIHGHATHAQAPAWFTTAPIAAIRKLLEQVGWDRDQVDLYEINEAFAVVAMAAMRDLGLPHDKVNVHGGACALGHPIGASGARLVVTLLAALKRHGLRSGRRLALHRRRRGDGARRRADRLRGCMGERRRISSGSSFEEIAGYSRAVVDGDWVFVSGTTGFDYRTGAISEEVALQTEQCFRNIQWALEQAGSGMADLVRIRIYLANAADFAAVAPIVGRWCREARPANTTIVSALVDPRMKIEIEVTAKKRALMEGRATVAAPIDFYFDFSSPYGYLASRRIEAIAARHGRDVAWRPYLLGVAFQKTGQSPLIEQPLRGAYHERDFARSARLHGIPFRLPEPFPFMSVAAARAFYWMDGRDPTGAKAYAEAVFGRVFEDGIPVATPEAAADIADRLGHDRDRVLTALADPAVKARLRQVVDEALARGVFGSPFIFVDGEPFWGNDRLEQVDRWLETGGW